jgi:hypothetical protein
MTQPIFILSTQPRFDRLNVLQLRCPETTPVNGRIYAQAQLGISMNVFSHGCGHLKTTPRPKSAFHILFQGAQGLVRITASAAGRTVFETRPENRATP